MKDLVLDNYSILSIYFSSHCTYSAAVLRTSSIVPISLSVLYYIVANPWITVSPYSSEYKKQINDWMEEAFY